MRPLRGFLDADYTRLEGAFNDVGLDQARALEAHDLRSRILSSGRRIENLETESSLTKPKGAGFLSGDSSSAVRELRYHALWGVHSACVYAVYDGVEHEDVLVGHGKVRYRDMLYSSELKVGSIVPYSEVDLRANSIRVLREVSHMLRCLEELSSEGRRVDYVLLDGSMQTNLRNLAGKGGGFKEDSEALAALRKLMSHGNLVGLVEDSHATDLSRELGFDYTNMLLFEVALSPGEYVTDERDGVFICYIKLPSKAVDYLPSRTASPLTVRWEFNKKDFRDDLNLLSGIWLSEDDLLHPQLYPIRVTDYLTRKLKVGGILDSFAQEKGLDLKYRDMREG